MFSAIEVHDSKRDACYKLMIEVIKEMVYSKFKKKFNKKASLNLSIEAIVIVVIAFVVLGLALGFVKGQFEQITDTSSSVQDQIQQQIMDDLRRSNNKLSFPSDELTLELKDEEVQAVGIKNTDDQSKFFAVTFHVKDGIDFADFISGEKMSLATSAADVKIFWDNDYREISAGDTDIIKFSLTAPDKQGTYLYKIVLWEAEDSRGAGVTEYATANFFVKTS